MRLLGRHLDAHRHPAQVLLAVGLAYAGRVGEPDHRRVRNAGLREARPEILREVAERQLGPVGGQGRLGVDRTVDRVRDSVRAGCLRVLQLDPHDLAGQLAELGPLGLGAAPDHGLCPRSLHAASLALVPCTWMSTAYRGALSHRSWNLSSMASTSPAMTPSGDGL